MADIELVISIPKDSYKATCRGSMLPPDVKNVIKAIKDGIPLPEGHGRLVDADAFDETLNDGEIKARKQRKYVLEAAINTIRGNLKKADTIIEAESEG